MFVMDHIEKVGPRPSIHIGPISVHDLADPDGTWTDHFEVAVDGMIHQEESDE